MGSQPRRAQAVHACLCKKPPLVVVVPLLTSLLPHDVGRSSTLPTDQTTTGPERASLKKTGVDGACSGHYFIVRAARNANFGFHPVPSWACRHQRCSRKHGDHSGVNLEGGPGGGSRSGTQSTEETQGPADQRAWA